MFKPRAEWMPFAQLDMFLEDGAWRQTPMINIDITIMNGENVMLADKFWYQGSTMEWKKFKYSINL